MMNENQLHVLLPI